MAGAMVYIVDYDIPESPARSKIQFYRDLKKVRRIFPSDYSTLSVFRTQERMAAEAVYLLVASHGGSAHMYAAEEIFLR